MHPASCRAGSARSPSTPTGRKKLPGHFRLWFAPVQANICPITSDSDD
jgi:hypothetical protein